MGSSSGWVGKEFIGILVGKGMGDDPAEDGKSSEHKRVGMRLRSS